ncbi:hypothetical protein M378DRAFT_27805 [Amanita muscaria Koide BX008]|uniref:PIPK domain-containing protein n=1 Tax=Amanita muscaria (strain Koide BX008) TaxID=946122 RepID=A0A0C2W9H9_AMAMK|nr:hypothetical protein M378DRAFT_27805 [Amanita muscaria Koide BX008]
MSGTASEKPLPSLPPPPLTSLSSESRQHRSHFIRHILSEISLDHDASPPGDSLAVEDWARAIEDALDDLSLVISRENWLKGFRRRAEEKRKQARQHRPGSADADSAHWGSLLKPRAVAQPGTPQQTTGPKADGTTSKASSSTSSNMPPSAGSSQGHTASIASSTSSNTIGDKEKQHSKETHAIRHDDEPVVDQDEAHHILTQIRKFTSTSSLPNPEGTSDVFNHLVLCAAPFGSGTTHVSSGSAATPTMAHASCVYMSGVFSVSVSKAPSGVVGQQNTTILYGLNDWESSLALSQSSKSQLRVVGGTFVLLGATSPQQHQSLITVLRASIYFHLALVLDQHLYSDFGIKLTKPRPKLEDADSPISKQSSPGEDRLALDYPSSPSTSGIRSSLFNFFSKRAASAFSHRSSTISSSPVPQQTSQYTGGDGTTGSRGHGLGRNRTIQVPRKSADGSHNSPIDDFSAGATSRSSLDSIGRRIRRFSLRGGDAGKRGMRTKKALPEIDRDAEEDPNKPYSSALRKIEKSRDILSTSFDVVVPLPDMLVKLAKLEQEGKDGRTTLLGWEEPGSESGKEAWGRGMSGLTGFTRHQELSVLVSRSVVRRETTIPAGSSGLETSNRVAVPHAHTAEPEGLPSLSADVKDDTQEGKDIKDVKEGKPDVKDVIAKEAPKDESVKLESKDSKPDAKNTATKDTAKDSTKETKTSAIRTHNPCGRPRWTTFWYYSESSSLSLPKRDHDPTLGEVIQNLSAAFSLDCDEPRCHYKCGEHQLKFVHDGVRVDVHLSSAEGEGNEEGKGKEKAGNAIPLRMWEACTVCDKKSMVREMSDGTYLLSFAKYLELLIYSTLIHSSSICEHTSATNPEHQSDSKPNKFNITRHFSASETCTVTFTLSEAKDTFELHLPRLQMSRTGADSKDKARHPLSSDSDSPNHGAMLLEEDRIQLRREIKLFWEGVSDYLDKIEGTLSGPDGDVTKRALPRLPSVTDDAYEDMFAPQTTSTISTYLTTGSSLSSGDSMMDPVVVRVSREDHQHSSQSSQTSALTTTTTAAGDDPRLLLASMRYSFQRAEQSLYGQLAHSPITLLNDVRRSFLASGRGAEKRVTAWKKKHLSLLLNANQQDLLGELKPPEPGWWDKKCHPLPGGYVVVQEGDLGSIIAFTLSSADFLMGLCNAPLNRSTSATNLASSTSTGTVASEFHSPFQPSTPSATSATTTKGYKFFSNSSALSQQQQLDPDKEDVVWHETEACAAVVTRKEHTRDSASLLSIRDMLRSRTPIEPGGGGASGTLSSAKAASPIPPSAWSKPADAQLSREEAGGTVFGLPQDTIETAGKVLQGLEATPSNAASASSSSLSPSKREREQGNDRETDKDRGREKPPALSSSAFSSVSDVTVGLLQSVLPPEVPPKDHPGSTFGSPPLGGQKSQQQASASFANTLTNSLSYALRLVSSGASTPRGGSVTAILPAPPAKPHHGLLLIDGNVPEEKPHIRYEVMVGKRIKLACTVYYARQFDLLRKRCGIDDIFVKSLSHSTNWAAEGGKSRANFWKTSDDRFVIKTLVNAWNVADLHVLLESGPSYFRYMESTVSKPTVLVKILGVYTVEVKNSESGTTSKVDLVVMENLFYNYKVDKTFDLKGIQGRKVKVSAGDVQEGQRRQTLFDGEWIEGQQKALMLVRPEWKKVLREAVKSDADFLAKMNIMDYSLLLGIDLKSKQLTCGLVDTIGSYTFAKTLEYKAKQGLQSGKDITVIPPAEYEERFVNAMEGYFIACPDKWSRPLDDRRIPHSSEQLPSVL